MGSRDRREDAEGPELPWGASTGDAGAAGIFLMFVILFVGVGIALYVSTGILFPG